MKEDLIKVIEAAKNGDENAFNKLFEESQQTVYYSCLKIVGNEQDALDLSQEIFLKIYKNLSSLKNNETYFSWLKVIIANTCKNHFSRGNKDIILDGEEYDETIFNEPEQDISLIPHEALDNKATEEIMMSIFSGLPESQRLCIIMYYYDEMSIKEIASALDVSENTVKSRLSYAKKSIGAEVEKQENENGLKLYGIAPLFFLRSLSEKEASNIPLPNNLNNIKQITKVASGALKNGTSDNIFKKAVKKISDMSLKNKILSAICATAVICVPAGLAINQAVVNKNTVQSGTSVSAKAFSSPEKVVSAYLEARIKQNYETMFECCDYSETEFVNKETYTKYYKARSLSEIKSFKVQEQEETTNPIIVKAEVEYRQNELKSSDTITFKVRNTTSQGKAAYKIITDDGLYDGYKIKAPMGATVTVDGTKVSEEYAEETEEHNLFSNGLRNYYYVYTIPEMFIGDHRIKVEGDFLKPMEQGTDFNKGDSDFTNFEITEEFGTKITEDMKVLTRKILENGFSKTGTYENIISESGYSVGTNVTALKKAFDRCYNRVDTESKTGDKNYKLSDDTDISLKIELGTIKVTVRCSYEYDYFYYTSRLVNNHSTGNAEFKYNLIQRDGKWTIAAAYADC